MQLLNVMQNTKLYEMALAFLSLSRGTSPKEVKTQTSDAQNPQL